MSEKDLPDGHKRKMPIIYPSKAEALRAMELREKKKQSHTSARDRALQLQEQERLAKQAEERERKDIQEIIGCNVNNNAILDADIFIIDVSALCKSVYEGYVIGEASIVRFNVRNGILDNLHEIIIPPDIPFGYQADVKRGCKEFALKPFLFTDTPITNYARLLAAIIDYLKQNKLSSEDLPPLYTMPEKIPEVKDFLGKLSESAHAGVDMFRVYRLDTLFFTLINSLKKHSYEGIPKQSLALAMLQSDKFWGTSGICCDHHQEIDRITVCSKSVANCLAFSILDGCCPLAGVEPQPGCHKPGTASSSKHSVVTSHNDVVASSSRDVVNASSPRSDAVASSSREVVNASSPRSDAVASSSRDVVNTSSPRSDAVASSSRDVVKALSPRSDAVASSSRDVVNASSPRSDAVASSPRSDAVASSSRDVVNASSPRSDAVASSSHDVVLASGSTAGGGGADSRMPGLTTRAPSQKTFPPLNQVAGRGRGRGVLSLARLNLNN